MRSLAGLTLCFLSIAVFFYTGTGDPQLLSPSSCVDSGGSCITSTTQCEGRLTYTFHCHEGLACCIGETALRVLRKKRGNRNSNTIKNNKKIQNKNAKTNDDHKKMGFTRARTNKDNKKWENKKTRTHKKNKIRDNENPRKNKKAKIRNNENPRNKKKNKIRKNENARTNKKKIRENINTRTNKKNMAPRKQSIKKKDEQRKPNRKLNRKLRPKKENKEIQTKKKKERKRKGKANRKTNKAGGKRKKKLRKKVKGVKGPKAKEGKIQGKKSSKVRMRQEKKLRPLKDHDDDDDKIRPPSTGCKSTKTCKRKKGKCRARCKSKEKALTGVCIGCSCCIREKTKKKCQPAQDECKDLGGKCRKTCRKKETQTYKDGCGDDCSCCMKAPKPNKPQKPESSEESKEPATEKPTPVPPPVTEKPTPVPPPMTDKPTTLPPPETDKPTTLPPPETDKPTTLPPPETEKPTTLPPPETDKPTTLPPPETDKPTTLPPPETDKPTTLPPPETDKPTTLPPPETDKPTTLPPPETEKPTTLPPPETEKPTTLPLTETEKPTTIPPPSCPNQPACDSGYGHCRYQCYNFERKEHKDGVCSQIDDCMCCTGRPATCRNNTKCPGVCVDKRFCQNHLPDYTCDGYDCICCAKNTLELQCLAGGGSCKAECDSDETSSQPCENGYYCCSPRDKCELEPRCDYTEGVCRANCKAWEREVKGGDDECGGSVGCRCCTSRPAKCSALNNTDACPGECIDRRSCHNPINHIYEGACSDDKDCVCCIKPSVERMCMKHGGLCKMACDRELEVELRYKCGPNTTCCLPNDQCQLLPSCSHNDGQCRAKCRDWERAVPSDECGSDVFLYSRPNTRAASCVCCTTKPAECPQATNDSCPGICVDSHICQNVVNNGSCGQNNDSNCVCCAQPTPMELCTGKRGTCRKYCDNATEDFVMECGKDYVCCLPRDTCQLQPRCDSDAGQCRASCRDWERDLPNSNECGSVPGCMCCTGRYAVCSDKASSCPGVCVDYRNCHNVIMNGTCSGDVDCVCCMDTSLEDLCAIEGGKCQLLCNPYTEEEVQSCGDKYHCCRPKDQCELSPSCDKTYGVCRSSCKSWEREVMGEKCGGRGFTRGCRCCTSRPAECNATSPNCHGDCIDHRMCHDPIEFGTCSDGPDCICCTPETTPEDRCKIKDGVCKPTCISGVEQQIHNCGELGYCCVPSDACQRLPSCDDHNGQCRLECYEWEREEPNECGGSPGCKCCTARPAECNNVNCQGECVDHRNCTKAAKGRCDGTGCMCCSTCSMKPDCDDHFGKCRSKCYDWEREVPDECGDDCKCCTGRLASCSNSDSDCIGNCVDHRSCQYAGKGSCAGDDCMCCADLSPKDLCASKRGTCKEKCDDSAEVTDMDCGKDYVCCLPKDTCQLQPRCDADAGECRDSCREWELELENNDDCGGEGCKCCTGRRSVSCQVDTECPGRCVDFRSCSNILMHGACSEDGKCVCCAHIDKDDLCAIEGGICRVKVCLTTEVNKQDCENSQVCCIPIDECQLEPRCDDTNGVCRGNCMNWERELQNAECGSSGCRCCTSRPAVCIPDDTSTCTGECIDHRECNDQIEGETCSGDGCMCCNPDTTPEQRCASKRGVCKPTCKDMKEEEVHPCGTSNKCCVPTDECKLLPDCDYHYGRCRSKCYPWEIVKRGECGDSADCKCCTSRPAKCYPSHSCRGMCVDKRLCLVEGSGRCSGRNCLCCLQFRPYGSTTAEMPHDPNADEMPVANDDNRLK